MIDKFSCPFEFILGKTKNNFLPLHPKFKEILLHPCINFLLIWSLKDFFLKLHILSQEGKNKTKTMKTHLGRDYVLESSFAFSL